MKLGLFEEANRVITLGYELRKKKIKQIKFQQIFAAKHNLQITLNREQLNINFESHTIDYLLYLRALSFKRLNDYNMAEKLYL